MAADERRYVIQAGRIKLLPPAPSPSRDFRRQAVGKPVRAPVYESPYIPGMSDEPKPTPLQAWPWV